MVTAFLINQLIFFGILYVVFFGFGCAVQYAGLRPNYSRKMVSFCFFYGSMLADALYWRGIDGSNFLSSIFIVLFFLGFSERVSKHSSFLRTCFKAVARPEDYPYSLRWILTEYVATYAIIMLCIQAMLMFQMPMLIMMPLLIITFADGLAEPVGIRFGRHRYTVKALFTQQPYTRSVEGSLCVFVVSALIVLLYAGAFSPIQFYCAVLLIPATVMLAEAFSPHTCDGPLICLVTTADLIILGYIN